MNYTLKAIQTIAISVPIILCSETTVQAEEISDNDFEPQFNTAQNLKPQTTQIATKSQAEERSNSRASEPLVSISYVPKNLNPSNNLLQLPAKSSEVNIEIDEAISLQQAVKLAIKNNPNLQESRLNLESSQKGLRAAKAALYPRLDTEVRFSEAESVDNNIGLDITRQKQDELIELQQNSESTESFPAIESDDEDRNTTSLRGDLILTYNLYTGGSRGATIQIAEKLVDSSQLNLEAAILETRFTTISNYYSLQGADSQVEIEKGAVNEAQQTL